jgi:hypothetical protein
MPDNVGRTHLVRIQSPELKNARLKGVPFLASFARNGARAVDRISRLEPSRLVARAVDLHCASPEAYEKEAYEKELFPRHW